MSKEIWINVYEDFVTQNEREPTDEEMQDKYADHYAYLIDCYDD